MLPTLSAVPASTRVAPAARAGERSRRSSDVTRASAATELLPRHHSSHSALAPRVSSMEMHGCYRITGPITLTPAEMPNAMEANLGEGATIELLDPDGNILISRESLDDPRCMCMGHHVEIQGPFDIDVPAQAAGCPQLCKGTTGAGLLHTYTHDGKLVVSSDALTQGTSIRVAPGSVLLHPVTVIRRSDAGT